MVHIQAYHSTTSGSAWVYNHIRASHNIASSPGPPYTGVGVGTRLATCRNSYSLILPS